jgi:hypothetical protein
MDGGATDVGSLVDWSISITYGAAPATAVFTPTAGLFTNAAGTTAYTGGAVNQVYAAPTTNTTYTATVTTGLCTGAPQSIAIAANSAVGGTATLNNPTVCAGGNTSFVLGGTLTGGPAYTHNYQVSTDNGLTYTNLTNGGVYSGVNTSTLTLTNVPASFNNYKYRDSINTPGGCGFIRSTVGTLTVNPTPVVTITTAPYTKLFPGLFTTLTASSTSTISSYQWTRNGVNVTGATTNKYIVDIDKLGTYTVKVNDANGCASVATIPASITISDSVNRETLFIYPSPNSGQFQVRYFGDVNDVNTTAASVHVYDSKGARVFSRNYNPGGGYGAMNVDLGAHGRGVYRVDVLNSRGERIKTGSVMVF